MGIHWLQKRSDPREYSSIMSLDEALFLEVVICLAIIDIALLVLQLFHRLLLKYLMPTFSLQSLRHYTGMHNKRTMRSNTGEVGYVRAIASSIFVISWKCLVLGKPRARIPNACLDSWKCRSKFFLSQICVNRLVPPHKHHMKDAYRPIYTWSEQISHRYSTPNPWSLYSQ
jgi:hypothetical protein